jgi:hypothetical protein
MPTKTYKTRRGMCEDAPCCGCCGPEPFDNEPEFDSDF